MKHDRVQCLSLLLINEKQTYMSREIIEAGHHDEDHKCHCELGRHQVRPAKSNTRISHISGARLN